MQIHAGLGKERSRIKIVRISFHDLPHCVVIALGRFSQVGFRISRKAQSHGRDVGLLAGRSAGAQIAALLNCFVRLLEAILAGGIVVVGSDSLGDSQ